MDSDRSNILTELPAQLAERSRLIGSPATPRNGEFVLYWMHHAMRDSENPALDVAVTHAKRLGLPVLVYQSIPARYPYASDRHHAFLLEGARDLCARFAARGINYALHVERPSRPSAWLNALCDRAAMVITEDIPVEPFRTWTDQLSDTIEAPLVAVDTACVVPMQLVGRAYERAFQYRNATESEYSQRTTRQWQDMEPPTSVDLPDLPFEPIDFGRHSVSDLIGECEIDHTIAPVPHTRGGSTAGYARWDAFRENGLKDYSERRNDPLLEGNSRLSAYLHLGMVSPMRIAREAAAEENAGATKFLDELLIWRELAYAFCFYRRDHGSLAAIPSCAQKTLAEHAADPRPVLHSWETLARGETGDRLWDAAQKSLLIHGELHNNVRMTWGKAILNWTVDASTGLDTIIDLNHRFALDGNDPASYGGILWCLGQFDRAFPPVRPILGTVRDRSTAVHSRWLDPDQYFRYATRPLVSNECRVGIIGAGISGLACARTLRDHGLDVTVFEKSRGVGGRMATRRTETGVRFDHGAQYFTARDERFRRHVRSWIDDGIVEPWSGRIATLTGQGTEYRDSSTLRFVGCPGMNAVCRHLAGDLDVRFQTRISSVHFDGRYWRIGDAPDAEPLGEFDYLITTAPAPQSAELLAGAGSLQSLATAVDMSGCWAIMLTLAGPSQLPFDGAFVQESPLSWIARNSSKPQRDGGIETWILHASPEWTNEWIDAEPDEVLPILLDAFWQATGLPTPDTLTATAHRWRFALPANALGERCLFEPDMRVGACGDWCGGPRVEGAFLSGAAMAGRVLGHWGDWAGRPGDARSS